MESQEEKKTTTCGRSFFSTLASVCCIKASRRRQSVPVVPYESPIVDQTRLPQEEAVQIQNKASEE